jgi:cell division protease FtsH
MWLPEEDKYTNRKNELIAGLVVGMGGRVAEEIVFGDVTNGARGDIGQATGISRRMVCEWGMSEKMGMVEYGEHEDYVFLGRDISRARDYSEATAEQIDGEVRKLIDGAQIKEIIEHGRLINPPPGNPPPTQKMPPEKPPKQVVVAPDVTPPLPGALGGAPA